MTRYATDRDGNRLPDTGADVVVEPKDVRGTWRQYLTLYAHVVRERVDRETEQLERETRIAAIQAALDRRFAGHRVQVDVGSTRFWEDFVIVINRGGYVGESTAREVEYAITVDKPVGYAYHAAPDGSWRPSDWVWKPKKLPPLRRRAS